jgi:hypothetical protein
MRRAPYRGAARLLLGLASIASVIAVSAVLLGDHSSSAPALGILYLLPACLLGVVLVSGRYPGESTLKRLRESLSGRSPRPVSSQRPPEHPTELLRGGRLIAVSLAGRAPPPVAACC